MNVILKHGVLVAVGGLCVSGLLAQGTGTVRVNYERVIGRVKIAGVFSREPAAGERRCWQELEKLDAARTGGMMETSSTLLGVTAYAAMSHSGKTVFFANTTGKDVTFTPDVRGDLGCALNLYRMRPDSDELTADGVWRSGAAITVPAKGLLLCTTAIQDEHARRHGGDEMRVNRNRFAGGNGDIIRYANPFIGTSWNGHTFPGASWPFGMAQASPDSGNGDWQHCSGYVWEDPWIYGFSQTHLNGTGCTDLQDVRLMPFVGEDPVRLDDYRGAKDFGSECAWPGYYTVQLTNFNIKAELSATAHVGWHRYTFPEGKRARLLVDLQYGGVRALKLHHRVIEAQSDVAPDRRSISGQNLVYMWLQERWIAFDIRFSKPFASIRRLPMVPGDKAFRYVLDFDLAPGEQLLVKAALSGTDVAGARRNLAAEAPGWDFDAAVARCGDAWRELLSRVEVLGASEDEKEIFYTSTYHLFLQPNNLADVDGRARDAAAKIFQTRRGRHYTGFSLWDTFRAAHPFYTLVVPEMTGDFIDSMLAQYRSIGFLPVIPYFGRESYCMIGNHSVPVIVDAWLKGLRDFDGVEAFTAITNSLTVMHKRPDGRPKIKENWDLYDRYGYYPFDFIRGESVSRTLECAYDDWCAAEMAKSLGYTESEKFFRRRAGYWRNVFDPKTKRMRGKDSKGNWREPFDPAALGHGGTGIANDYTEGNSWQYTWHVFQDPEGLVDAMGGKQKFAAELDALFGNTDKSVNLSFMQDVTGTIGQYCHGNEPSHHVAWFYAYADRPDRVAERLREISTRFYTPTADGLCGNDDCGQMGAWYVFAAMGFYPFNPCGGDYVIGAPQLPCVRLRLAGGKTFTVTARNISERNRYVKSIMLNGRPFKGFILKHCQIMQGGELVFDMTDRP